MPTAPRQTLSLESDLLGSISAHLRDLSGYATLAYELIQNADDAGSSDEDAAATRITFAVDADALSVSNDGTFSSCENPYAKRCPDERRCDLHSFRLYAGQAKRQKDDTTGAFGIGFTVAYQVTDEPEMISAGQHWILRPHLPPQDRILVCHGCDRCANVTGTTFRLPWAREQTESRRELGVDPVSDADIDELCSEISTALPLALLFLRRLKRATLERDGAMVTDFSVARRDSGIHVESRNHVDEYTLVEGDFDDDAADLRAQHRRIEESRRSEVVLAIPNEGELNGRPFATLPTNQRTGLNFHFNADFFPRSDRKGINLEEGDYQATWNHAAIIACAEAFVGGLTDLREQLAPVQLWRTIASTQAIEDEVDAGLAETLEEVAEIVRVGLPRLEIAPLTNGGWDAPSKALVLRRHEPEFVKLLEDLKVPVVGPEVNEAIGDLDPALFGFTTLTANGVAEILADHDLTTRVHTDDLPLALKRGGRLEALWAEIEFLLSKGDDPGHLTTAACLPGVDGDLWPPEELSRADDESTALLSPWVPLLASSRLENCQHVKGLAAPLEIATVIQRLGGGADLCREADLLAWLAERLREISEHDLESEAAELPIFEDDAGEFAALPALRVPAGTFTDPAGVTRLVAPDLVATYRSFLVALGAEELTLESYVTEVIPEALEEAKGSPPWLRDLLQVLQDNLTDLRQISGAQVACQRLEAIPTAEGLTTPKRAFFPTDAAQAILGSDGPFVSPKDENRFRPLFDWLGVRRDIPSSKVLERIRDLTTAAPTAPLAQQMNAVFKYLIDEFQESDAPSPELKRRTNLGNKQRFDRDFADLRKLSWLPAAGDRDEWHQPRNMTLTTRRHLVGTHMPLLDLPKESRPGRLLRLLEVSSEPPPEPIVRHLADLSADGKEPHPEIYRQLDHVEDEGQLEGLGDFACLWSGSAYFRPDQMFRVRHSLGPLRTTVPSALAKYTNLIQRLGVRDEPSAADAVAVLQELGGLGESEIEKLDASSVRTMAWEAWRLVEVGLLTGELETEHVSKCLKACTAVPVGDHSFAKPTEVFREDGHGLDGRFPDNAQDLLVGSVSGTAFALRTAGVRGLLEASVVEVRYESDGGITEAAQVLGGIRQLSGPIHRVVEEAVGGAAAERSARRLASLDHRCVFDLESRFVLESAGLETSWASTPAQYEPSAHTLYVTPDAIVPALARELGRMLVSADAATQVSGTLATILESASPEDAHTRLDQLGYARYATAPVAETETADTVEPEAEELEAATDPEEPEPEEGIDPGAKGTPDVDPAPAEDSPDDVPAAEDGESQPSEPSSGPEPSDPAPEPPGPAPTSPPSATPSETEGTDSNSGPPPAPSASSTGPKRDPRKTDAPPKRAPKHRQRDKNPADFWGAIVSYRGNRGDNGSSGGDEPEAARDASPEIEQAGVRAVLEFERSAGRYPEEMPKNHKGYDVESKDEDGNVLRYIEVKAVDALWGETFPKVTPAQMDTARTKQQEFWLYVVENAGSTQADEPIRIQNPYNRVTRFVFDPGWRAAGETSE